MAVETKIIDFKCSNCGGTLQSTGHSNGRVECPYCHTECIIDGLIKNAEILEKENINSGVSIDLDKNALNFSVVEALTSIGATYPLDIFQNGAIVDKKHVCVPSYLFYCNGMASFNYEAGVEKERISGGKIKSNGKVKYNTESYTDWTPMSGSTNASASVVAPGNREYSEAIKNIYANYDANKLVDVEELVLPTDVETRSFNLPQPAAFNEFVKPHMESLLVESAENSLRGKNFRGLSLGGCSVQKDEVLRLSLGLYQMAFQYKGTTHTLYLAGDGSKAWWDVQPVDGERTLFLAEKLAAQQKLSKSPFLTLAIICGVAALFTSGISLIGTVLFGILHGKRKRDRKAVEAEIEAFNNEAVAAKQNFLQSGNYIKGIG